ncbi:MAG: tetraacyldisaccharide 4'-kinase, partial [Chitinophagaceae bacterium]
TQSIFFTTILYGTPYHITSRLLYKIEEHTEVLLVTGIANPRPLKKFLEDNIQTYSMMLYGDHHVFSIDDWKDIKTRFNLIQAANRIILTTEKDAMRLLKFEDELANL